MEWLTNVNYGHWWILAGLLLILELAAPTYFFLWLGIAAASIGFLVLVLPSIPFEVQFIAFAALTVIAIFAWRYSRRVPPGHAESGLQAGDQSDPRRE